MGGGGAVSFPRCGWGDVCGCAVGSIDIGVGCCTVSPVFSVGRCWFWGFRRFLASPGYAARLHAVRVCTEARDGSGHLLRVGC